MWSIPAPNSRPCRNRIVQALPTLPRCRGWCARPATCGGGPAPRRGGGADGTCLLGVVANSPPSAAVGFCAAGRCSGIRGPSPSCSYCGTGAATPCPVRDRCGMHTRRGADVSRLEQPAFGTLQLVPQPVGAAGLLGGRDAAPLATAEAPSRRGGGRLSVSPGTPDDAGTRPGTSDCYVQIRHFGILSATPCRKGSRWTAILVDPASDDGIHDPVWMQLRAPGGRDTRATPDGARGLRGATQATGFPTRRRTRFGESGDAGIGVSLDKHGRLAAHLMPNAGRDAERLDSTTVCAATPSRLAMATTWPTYGFGLSRAWTSAVTDDRACPDQCPASAGIQPAHATCKKERLDLE